MLKPAPLLLLFLAPAVLGDSVTAQRQAGPDSSLQGVWQTVEVTYAEGGAKPSYRPTNTGLWIFTAKHYVVIADDAPTARPSLGDPAIASADHLRAVWGPLVAVAGTYERSGNVVTYRPMVSKNPERLKLGAYTRTVSIEGDTLTSVEVSTQKGPATNPSTVRLRRLE